MVRYPREHDTVNVWVQKERALDLFRSVRAERILAARRASRQFWWIFRTRGEVMFSHVNMMEVGMLRGTSAAQVRSFLTEIGTHWIPIEFDPFEVGVAELEPPRGQRHPVLSSNGTSINGSR